MVYSSKDFNVVDFCRDSPKHASMMAFAAPKVESLYIFPCILKTFGMSEQSSSDSHPLLRDSKSMEKDQLISMIHFLVKREDEPTNEASAEPNSFELCIARRRKNIIQRAQENQELKDMVKELRDTHKQDVKTQTSLLKIQSNLMKSIDKLTNQVADLTNQNRMISERIAELAQTLPSRD